MALNIVVNVGKYVSYWNNSILPSQIRIQT